jgi:ATP-binding cassette subfamily B protein
MVAVGRLLRFLKPYRLTATAALVLLLILVFIDLALPRLIQHIIDEGVMKHDRDTIVRTALWMLGLTLLSLVFATGNSVLSVVTGECFARDLRDALFSRVQDLSYANLDRLKTGPLIVRLTSDVQQLQQLVQIMLRIGTRGPLLMVGSVILLFATSPRLAIYVVPVLLLNALLIVGFVSRIQAMFAASQEKLDRLNNTLQENIAGVRVVKAFVRAAHEVLRFGNVNRQLLDQSIRMMETMSLLMPLLMVLFNMGIVVVVWAGGIQAIEGSLSVGEVVAFTNYLSTIMMPLMIMGMIASSLAGAGASAVRMEEVLDAQAMVTDAAQVVPFPNGKGAGARVAFEHVGFGYNTHGAEPVLRDVTLAVEPGETLAILGPTGAGKTTLVQLVPRFYDATSGTVLVDGLDVRTVSQETLLKQVAVVMQETTLFMGSMADNIRFGRPDASMDDVEEAARAAQAHEFIAALPKGYDTHVAERGVNLSGGQKQRVAIARALLLRPRILILDDATSAVDVETESRVQQALAARRAGCTTLVVAQRISTVLNADRIVVMEDGAVVAQGTHEALLKDSAVYREIYDSQLGGGPKDG